MKIENKVIKEKWIIVKIILEVRNTENDWITRDNYKNTNHGGGCLCDSYRHSIHVLEKIYKKYVQMILIYKRGVTDMENYLVVAIITLIVFITLILYKLIKVTLENKYTNDYNECVKNLYSNYQENGIYLYIYTFNKRLQFQIFSDVEKYMEFKEASQNYIKDVEFMKINSYDNYIQLE